MIFDREDPRIRNWCVLHVKPRTEKKLAAYLESFGIWHILALYDKRVKVQRRIRHTQIPVFRGYVFAKLNTYDKPVVWRSNYLVKIIAVFDQRSMIHQIRQVVHAGRKGRDLKVVPLFREGDLVRIKYGPLHGMEGYVKRDAGKEVLVLNVEVLGQAVEIKINPGDCVPAGGRQIQGERDENH